LKSCLAKIAQDENADEFVDIGDADSFKLYLMAGKTIKDVPVSFHENPRDVFMLLFEGEMELVFEDGEKANIRKGQYVHVCLNFYLNKV
jgi:quercetin dioxygenase-like cupin family protein